MGIIPVPISPGWPCLRCFAAGETPNLLKVFFAGIRTGDMWFPGLPPAPNGYHDFIQDFHNHCLWGADDPDEIGSLHWAATGSSVILTLLASDVAFGGESLTLCKRYFTNKLVVPAGHTYYGGYCYVSTPADMQAMIETVTPIVGPDPRMELFPMADGEIVVKFCNTRDGTNIKIKIDTSLL